MLYISIYVYLKHKFNADLNRKKEQQIFQELTKIWQFILYILYCIYI